MFVLIIRLKKHPENRAKAVFGMFACTAYHILYPILIHTLVQCQQDRNLRFSITLTSAILADILKTVRYHSGKRMKKILLLLWIAFAVAGYAPPVLHAQEVADSIEQRTGLKKVEGDRFILDLKYRSTDNFLHKDVYSDFGIEACYVHLDVHEKLMQLAPELQKKGLRLVLFDCYRPLEVQEAMWKIMPDAKYVANPKTGSLHNRGVAIDCALADEQGAYLEFPTAFDSFEKKAWQAYICPDNAKMPCDNRETLKQLMLSVGLSPITSEWWHFQLKDAKKYPLLPAGKGPRHEK